MMAWPGNQIDQLTRSLKEGRVEHTVPMLFSADETANVGHDPGTPVSADYNRSNNVFTGKVNWYGSIWAEMI